MPELNFAVKPIRDSMYGRDELFGGFDFNDPSSLFKVLDFKVYREYIMDGGAYPKTYYAGMMRSMHDYSILNEVHSICEGSGIKIVAMMGGHKMKRARNTTYETVAKITRSLTKKGYICVSGGGPGAMEATHLGAYFSEYYEDELLHAIEVLEREPELPNLRSLVQESGEVDNELLIKYHSWIKPVYELLRDFPKGGYSFSLPTWHYGHEPATPFATQTAKYFQNSIREDGLLAIAGNGVVFSEGKAGTVQEIFQDACQNYYKSFKWFSPMIFLGVEYWQTIMPVRNLLEKLISEKDQKMLKYTDDADEVIKFIEDFIPEV